MKNKILIGIPIHYTQKISEKLKADLKKLRGNFEVLFERDLPEDAYRGDRIYRIAKARERIRQYFLSKDFTHLLFIDSDISFPPETLEVLLSYDADLVFHGYTSKLNKLEIDTGFGCTLIKRKVLEEIPIFKGISFNKNFSGKFSKGEDILFKLRAKEKGFSIIDLSDKLEIKHLPYDFNNMIEQWVEWKRSNRNKR